MVKDSIYRRHTLDEFDYKVQAHDAIFINFESATDEKFDFLSRQNMMGGGGGMFMNVLSEIVDEKGEISFPEIGKVKVAGLNIFQIQDTLQVITDAYLKGPKVRARLVNFRFTVLGEVNLEGTITVMNNRVTIPEAIGLAGGLGELADRSNIKLIRHRGAEAEVAYINLLDENLVHSPYYFLNQTDLLIVPPLRQRPFRRYFGTNFALFTSSLSVILLIINLTSN